MAKFEVTPDTGVTHIIKARRMAATAGYEWIGLLQQKRELTAELEEVGVAVWDWEFIANLRKHDYDQCLKAVLAADALIEAIEARGEIGAALDAYRKARIFD